MKQKKPGPDQHGFHDTCFVGTVKSVGHIYQQTFIDTYGRVNFAKHYSERATIIAVHALKKLFVPWFAEQEVGLLGILTNRAAEYCGKIEERAFCNCVLLIKKWLKKSS